MSTAIIYTGGASAAVYFAHFGPAYVKFILQYITLPNFSIYSMLFTPSKLLIASTAISKWALGNTVNSKEFISKDDDDDEDEEDEKDR